MRGLVNHFLQRNQERVKMTNRGSLLMDTLNLKYQPVPRVLFLRNTQDFIDTIKKVSRSSFFLSLAKLEN